MMTHSPRAYRFGGWRPILRWSERRCMRRRRAASETLPPQSASTRCRYSYSTRSSEGTSSCLAVGEAAQRALAGRGVDGLGQVVDRARAHRLDGVRDRPVAGEHDDARAVVDRRAARRRDSIPLPPGMRTSTSAYSKTCAAAASRASAGPAASVTAKPRRPSAAPSAARKASSSSTSRSVGRSSCGAPGRPAGWRARPSDLREAQRHARPPRLARARPRAGRRRARAARARGRGRGPSPRRAPWS